MASEPLVAISSEIMSGTLVFYGTRVPIKNLVDYLRAGKSIAAFLDEFPTVTHAQIMRYLETREQYVVEDLLLIE
jgi:uncharacterized protein (DUF433 family)